MAPQRLSTQLYPLPAFPFPEVRPCPKQGVPSFRDGKKKKERNFPYRKGTGFQSIKINPSTQAHEVSLQSIQINDEF